jgi:hypothetical protein
MAAMSMVSVWGFSGVSYHSRKCPQGVASVLCKKITPIFGSWRSKLDHLTVIWIAFNRTICRKNIALLKIYTHYHWTITIVWWGTTVVKTLLYLIIKLEPKKVHISFHIINLITVNQCTNSSVRHNMSFSKTVTNLPKAPRKRQKNSRTLSTIYGPRVICNVPHNLHARNTRAGDTQYNLWLTSFAA